MSKAHKFKTTSLCQLKYHLAIENPTIARAMRKSQNEAPAIAMKSRWNGKVFTMKYQIPLSSWNIPYWVILGIIHKPEFVGFSGILPLIWKNMKFQASEDSEVVINNTIYPDHIRLVNCPITTEKHLL